MDDKPVQGRPRIGETKHIKLTLPVDTWEWVEQQEMSRSEFLRSMIEFAKTYKETFQKR